MKNSDDFFEYCVTNGYTVGKEDLTHKCCLGLETVLLPGEDVWMCFMGIHGYVSAFSYEGFYLYALTNLRFLIVANGFLSYKHIEYPKEKIQAVNFFPGSVFGKLQITISGIGKIVIGMNKMFGEELHGKLEALLFPKDKEQSVASFSVADELLKMKSLLDAGVLTQSEFDQQKELILKSRSVDAGNGNSLPSF